MVSDRQTIKKMNDAINMIEDAGIIQSSDQDLYVDGERYASTIVLPITNLFVDGGAALLVGGKGSGKTQTAELMGMLATSKWNPEKPFAYLLADSDLRRTQIVGMLNPIEFQRGILKVDWSDFAINPIKILDEINRMASSAYSYFMSMLGSKEISLYGNYLRLESYRVYSTMNHPDEGTTPIPPPMLDRFSIAIPFSKISSKEGEMVLQRPDADMGGRKKADEQMQALISRCGLTESEFYNLPSIASKLVKIPDDVLEKISLLVKDFGICERADSNDKDLLHEVKPPKLCLQNKCRYYGKQEFICYMSPASMSERASLALKRYSIALAAILEKDEVSMEIVQNVARFVFCHRIIPTGEIYEKDYYSSQLMQFARDTIERSIHTSSMNPRKQYVLRRNEALSSNNPDKIRRLIEEITAKLDDPIKYDLIKSLRRKLAFLSRRKKNNKNRLEQSRLSV